MSMLPPTRRPPVPGAAGSPFTPTDPHASPDPAALARIVALCGGQRRVARAAGNPASSLSRFLKGGRVLSAAAIGRLLDAVGLPEGPPDPARVHRWTARTMDAAALDAALRRFFVRRDGRGGRRPAEIARLVLSNRGRDAAGPDPDVDRGGAVYALRDGRVHALLRLPRGARPPVEAMTSLCWFGRHERVAVVATDDPTWFAMDAPAPEVGAFAAAWPTFVLEPTDAELLTVIRRMRLGNTAVVEILRRHTD